MAIIINSKKERPTAAVITDYSLIKKNSSNSVTLSETPGREECLHLLSMAEQIIQGIPEQAPCFYDWQQKTKKLLQDDGLETLAGEAQLELLAMELRGLWLMTAHGYSDPHLKSPPQDVEKKLPMGSSAHYHYERLVYPRNLEKRAPEYRPIPLGWIGEHIFFRSGLSAIAALFQGFGQVLSKDNRTTVKIDMFGGYYETQRLLRAFSSPLFKYRRVVKQLELFERVENEKSNVLFLEPVSYDWDLDVLDFEQLLHSLAKRQKPPRVVILDTTIVGHGFPLDLFLHMLPGDPPPLVVVLSSGLKLDQEGLELANVGMLTLFNRDGNEEQEELADRLTGKLRRNRNLFGYGLLMDEMAILDVPWFLHLANYKKHCSHVFDNNRRLAAALSPVIANGEGIFSHVSHPCLSAAAGWSWANAPFVVFHFKPEFDSEENHTALVATILRMAKERNLGFIGGMSFGFRSSRFEIIKPNAILHPNGNQKGLLKVAMGRRSGVQVAGVIKLLSEVAVMTRFSEIKREKLGGGDRLLSGRYEIIEKVGEGNFALVFKVREVATGRIFAAKKATVARKPHVYKSEVAKLTILRGGPHILPLHEAELDEDGAMVMVTEYFDGGNLKEAILSRGHLTIDEALGVLGQMLKAVAYSHACKPPILHRDIKPSNIQGRITGKNRMEWYLVDWGLAANWHNAKEPAVSGTHSYTAPEVWRKKRYLVSEVYSLGMTLYYMLFGRPAYEGGTDTISKAQKAPKPVGIPQGCPKHIKKLLEGMLEKNPKKRWSLDRVIATVNPEGKKKRTELVLQRRNVVGKVWQVDVAGVALDFKWIPAGSFAMGQGDGEGARIIEEFGQERHRASFSRELPVHEVRLDGFWLCRTLITRELFASFQKASGYKTLAQQQGSYSVWNSETGKLERKEGGDWRQSGFGFSADHPVVNVSYVDAMAMAEWLSQRSNRLIGLPSEAQWEYACRGGVETTFSVGDIINTDQANFDGRKASTFCSSGVFRGGTTAVEHFVGQENGFGLLDMHGNVYEWCRDWYEADFYQSSTVMNPRSVRSSSGERVIRGGSWLSPALRIRSAYRDRFAPDNYDADIGFRFVGLAYPWEK
ncbi:MAG: SUMF1/EgtB/PvdO family nonheme iron enzyme [Magnetococcales bacterium]|nr:SUMF1/EgtB/PvdO family nonheme iron enzyme [Magnetococcales bacterium]